MIYVVGDAAHPVSTTEPHRIIAHCVATEGKWSGRGVMGQISASLGDEPQEEYEAAAGALKLGGVAAAPATPPRTPSGTALADVFAGCRVYLHGKSEETGGKGEADEEHAEVERHVIAYDGDIISDVDSAAELADATHIIVLSSGPRLRGWLGSKTVAAQCVSPAWLWESITAKKRANEAEYAVSF